MGEPLPRSVSLGSTDVRDLAIEVARVLDEKRGEEIVVIDVEALLPITRYFVIASASSSRALQSLAESSKKLLDASPLPRVGVDASRESRWVCMDFADVVVHLFHREVRGFYDLDHLWGDAPRIEWAPSERAAESDESESGVASGESESSSSD